MQYYLLRCFFFIVSLILQHTCLFKNSCGVQVRMLCFLLLRRFVVWNVTMKPWRQTDLTSLLTTSIIACLDGIGHSEKSQICRTCWRIAWRAVLYFTFPFLVTYSGCNIWSLYFVFGDKYKTFLIIFLVWEHFCPPLLWQDSHCQIVMQKLILLVFRLKNRKIYGVTHVICFET